MAHGFRFSFRRLLGMVIKELIQLRRDRLTFAMIFGIPLAQLLLFGYVINSDPRHLPAGVVMADNGPQARAVLKALQNSTFFDFVTELPSDTAAHEQLARGELQFVVTIPHDFSRELVRGNRPAILLEADATDPSATQGALAQVSTIIEQTLAKELTGPLADLAPKQPPVELRAHAMYNPEVRTTNNIVPGLIGVILTLTMVMVTAMAITRERERGTMENLLSMPTRPSEVLIGKIIPYVIIGYVQIGLILFAARYVFQVPIEGSVLLLLAVSLLFIIANLSLGITFSTIARNQLQAMQMTLFVFLPSMLLSGFMFPFRGMPRWAQIAGEILPITHFIRIARGIMLKGNGAMQMMNDLGPIALFTLVVLTIGMKRYRKTLD